MSTEAGFDFAPHWPSKEGWVRLAEPCLVAITLTDMQTGRARTLVEKCKDGTDYVWTDGNFGCDCNRSLFLYGDGPCELDCNPFDEENRIEAEFTLLKPYRLQPCDG